MIENEIQKNNHTLLESIKSLLDSSVQQLKSSSTQNAENQMKEITRLKYSEPHRFKKKANEDQHKFNIKVIDSLAEVSEALEKREITKAQDHLQKGEHMLNERQKHILLADKSEFGWATVHKYKKHELAEDSEDEKRILKSEIRAKAQRRQIRSKSTARKYETKPQREDLTNRYYTPNVQTRTSRASLNYSPATNVSNFKSGSWYSCGKFGHWRNECPGIPRR
jgi:hypothetical protein